MARREVLGVRQGRTESEVGCAAHLESVQDNGEREAKALGMECARAGVLDQECHEQCRSAR